MLPQRFGRSLVVAVTMPLCLGALGLHSEGVELVSQELIHDGSTTPPGFRIDVCLLGRLGDQGVQVRATGFRAPVAPATPDARSLPIKAADAKYSDDAGHVLIVQRVTPGDPAFCSLVVPYAALQMPEGKHGIWFLVTIARDADVIIAGATNVVPVSIGRDVRRSMWDLRKVARHQTVATRAKVFLAEPDPDGAVRGAPDEVQVQRLAEKEVVKTQGHMTQRSIQQRREGVEIAGGFDRLDQDEESPLVEGPANRWQETSLRQLDIQSLAGPWSTLGDVAPADRRIVFFATNRVPEEIDWPEEHLANGANSGAGSGTASEMTRQPGGRLAEEIRYGWCRVNVPVTRAKSASFGVWQVVSPPDPAKHYTLESVRYLDKHAFRRQVRKGDILLYVHGFRNQFSDAILRTAQLRYDLEFPGLAVAFCWPSDGALSEEVYKTMHQVADASVADLVEVAGLLMGETAGEAKRRIHIIAHSMGNRIVLGTIYRLFAQGALTGDTKPFGHVILAAPDIGLLAFHQQVPYAIAASETTTLYFCERDVALATSQKINYYEPAGRVPYLLGDLDSIDANAADTSFLAHSYYATSRQVLADMKLLVNHGLPPERRMPPLAARLELFGRPYWSFGREAGYVQVEP